MKSLFWWTCQSKIVEFAAGAAVSLGTETAASRQYLLRRKPMKKMCIAVVVAVTTLCATAPAFADYYHHHHCHWEWEWHHHHHVHVCR
jgi:hypothetical protein